MKNVLCTVYGVFALGKWYMVYGVGNMVYDDVEVMSVQ